MAFVLFNLAAVAALVGIDQLIKLWAVQVLQPVGAMPFIPHVVELRFVLNPGMAFSLLSGKQLFLIIATSVALLAICVFMMLGMELMNSAVERAVDKPDTTHWWSAGAAKDMAAGGVLVTAFGAVVVGICLFGNAAALNAIWTSVTATPLSTALWVLSLVLAYLFTFRLGKQEQVKTPKENKTEEK